MSKSSKQVIQVDKTQLDELLAQNEFYKQRYFEVASIAKNLVSKLTDKEGNLDLTHVMPLLTPLLQDMMMPSVFQSKEKKAKRDEELAKKANEVFGLDDLNRIVKIVEEFDNNDGNGNSDK